MIPYPERLPSPKREVISVIIPTFARPEMLRRCILSHVNLAKGVGRLEFCVHVKVEDIDSQRMVKRVAALLSTRVAWIAGPNLGYGHVHEYARDAAMLSSGAWLFFTGDDCEVLTEGWDALLDEWDATKVAFFETADERESTLTVGPLPLNLHGATVRTTGCVCSTQILSREAWVALGEACPHRAADTYLKEVFGRFWPDIPKLPIRVKNELAAGPFPEDMAYFRSEIEQGVKRLEKYGNHGTR